MIETSVKTMETPSVTVPPGSETDRDKITVTLGISNENLSKENDDIHENHSELSPLKQDGTTVAKGCDDEEVEEEETQEVQMSPEDKMEDELNKAPDGGWGWMIMFGSILVHVLMGGFERGNGVMFLQMTERFKESATSTSWIFSIFSTLRLLLGPLSSALCSRFSCRTVGMLGGFLAALGMFLSGFAPSLHYLYFTYGFLGGLGRSFIYTPGLIMVGLYFNKRRGLAVGLATSGVGIGTVIIPPLIEVLFTNFGFKGAFIILSGIVANFIVAASLFLPLEKYNKIRRKEMLAEIRKKNPPVLDTNQSAETSACIATETSAPTAGPASAIPTQSDVRPLLRIQTSTNVSTSMEIIAKSKVESRRPSLFLRRLSKLKMAMKGENNGEKKKQQPFIELSLLKNFTFLMLCIGIMLFTIAFNSGFVFLPPLTKSKGLSVIDSAFVVSIIGIVDGISRIVTSIALDLKKVKPFRLLIYNMSMFCVGTVAFIIPSMSTYLQFGVICAAYGVLSGMYISQKSVVIVDVLGVQNLSSSFGIILLFQGIGSIIGPTVGGILKDALGGYEGSFYFGACGIFLGSFCVMAGNIYKIVTDRSKKRLEQEETPV